MQSLFGMNKIKITATLVAVLGVVAYVTYTALVEKK